MVVGSQWRTAMKTVVLDREIKNERSGILHKGKISK